MKIGLNMSHLPSWQNTFSVILILLLLSCGRTYRFKDRDFEWIPYKGGESLVFTSNKGDTDTLFLNNPERYMEYDTDPLSLVKQDSLEKFHINFYFSDDTKARHAPYSDETIIAMTKKKNKTRIGFGVTTNDASFYGLKYFDIRQLRKAKLITLQTKLNLYNDILIIEPEPSNDRWSKRDHYVLRMYWSKSEGLIRYDKNNGVYYTLTGKYRKYH